jgi:hypothetical protein
MSRRWGGFPVNDEKQVSHKKELFVIEGRKQKRERTEEIVIESNSLK